MGRFTHLDLGDILAAAALVGGLFAVAALMEPAEHASSSVRVIDGDTLAVAGRRIRLKGMDAPELGQTCARGSVTIRCGEEAREALVALVQGREVACRTSGQDRYGRDLATCRAGGLDLGGTLVRRGLAVAYGGYALEELAARAEGRGIWAGSFERPSEYRKRHPVGSAGAT